MQHLEGLKSEIFKCLRLIRVPESRAECIELNFGLVHNVLVDWYMQWLNGVIQLIFYTFMLVKIEVVIVVVSALTLILYNSNTYNSVPELFSCIFWHSSFLNRIFVSSFLINNCKSHYWFYTLPLFYVYTADD